MAIYNIGSTYYLGDVKYGTFNVSYPAISYLEAFPHNAISAEISALCTAAGLSFRNVLPQASFDSYLGNVAILAFGANGDIDDRYTLEILSYDNNSSTSSTASIAKNSKLYNDSGYVPTNNSMSSTNLLARQGNRTQVSQFGLGFNTGAINLTSSGIQWMGCANANALSLVATQYDFLTNEQTVNFWYAGLLENVQTDFNYYSTNNISKSLLIGGRFKPSSVTYMGGTHYINSAMKVVLQSGFAEYSLSGSTSQWSGDFLVHDDNSVIGYPTIGEASLLRVLEGTYTIGKPAQLTGDVPNRLWLPIGTWTTNRTLAVEVYSS